ncbi:predicted protein [Naegleria gruberi]|uniref:Predicted protein n=1 Tax=Naegleria gruberi TaxID=5762 RepID=D2VFA4_NAEGR|nr:uncharacterized protein NAEGRDRAFT_67555 [Naegleria gruberi]EFC44335.1 predicted protein [Naegleria gruberi]|eukprot:XP_002677079.1 predicted protein [Naegleria gruberi strain NEG-M]
MFNKLGSLVPRGNKILSSTLSSSRTSIKLNSIGCNNFSYSLTRFDKTSAETKQAPTTEENTVATTTISENTESAVAAAPSEDKSTLTSGKSYNGIPLHKPPQHIKKLSFVGALARYTFYFVFFIWIFSGYPIYTACQFIYRLIHGEPEPEPVDEE